MMIPVTIPSSDSSLQGYLFPARGDPILATVVFLVLAYTLSSGFLTIFGAVYLLSLGLATGVTIRMRRTIEYQSQLRV